MSKNAKCNINDLFDLFSESLAASDVLASKLMSQISSAITKERIKLSMNQNDFAKHLNVSQSEISRWEHGDYNFSLKKISQIAEKLDMDIDIIFTNMSVKKNMEYESFSNSPSTYTIMYSPTEARQYKNKHFRKVGMEEFKHASIRK